MNTVTRLQRGVELDGSMLDDLSEVFAKYDRRLARQIAALRVAQCAAFAVAAYSLFWMV